jgi:hypothetical protein
VTTRELEVDKKIVNGEWNVATFIVLSQHCLGDHDENQEGHAKEYVLWSRF